VHQQETIATTVPLPDGDVHLEQLDSIIDLAVNFDSQLKFYKHIDDRINKAYSFLGIIKIN